MFEIKNEDVFKEIEQIQSCISRMAHNSFAIKGWHIGLVSALLVFFFQNDNINYYALFSIIAIVTLIFWYLDSYYLMLERKYRWKYQWVIEERVNKNTLNKKYFLDLNPDNSDMWKTNTHSKSYILATKTIEYRKQSKNKLAAWCQLREVGIVMFSNTMQAEYMFVFFGSVILEVMYILHILLMYCNRV